MQRLSSLFFILAAITSVLFSAAYVEAQKDIQADTIASLEAATRESNVVLDYCYDVTPENFKSPIISHGIVTLAAVFHEIALGLHAQHETNPFTAPDSVVSNLDTFLKALRKLTTAISDKHAIFVQAGLGQDFTDNLAFLIGKTDFFLDELSIAMPKSYRGTVNDVKYSINGAVEECIGSFPR